MKPTFKYSIGTDTYSRELIYSPVEWDNTDIKFTRNNKAHGVFRDFVLPLTFVYDGADLLRPIYYGQGVEGKATLDVKQLNTTTQEYDPHYSGDINFAEAKDDRDTFEVGIEDNGLEARIKAEEDTTFEIPILDSDSLQVLLDGIRLRNKVRYSLASFMISRNVFSRSATPDMSRTKSESDVVRDAFETVLFDTQTVENLSQKSNFYEASLSCTTFITINGTYNVLRRQNAQQNVSAGDQFYISIIRRRGTSNTFFPVFKGQLNNSFLIDTFNVSASLTIDVQPLDKLTLVFYIDPISNGATRSQYFFDTTDGVMTLSYDFRLPATTVRGYRYFDVLKKLMALIMPGSTVVSDYLTNPTINDYNTNPYSAVLTRGDAIRRIGNGNVEAVNPGGSPLTAPRLKFSFEDIRKDFFGRFFCGYSVEGNVLRVEPITYCYQYNVISVNDLGEVNNLQVTPYKEYTAKRFTFGQTAQDYNDINGRDEYNTEVEYRNPKATRITVESDHKYVFRSDIYGIEQARYALEDRDSTDSESDNDVFCIEISNEQTSRGEYVLARPQNLPGASIGGVVAKETAYNLGYSPKHCMYRAFPLIAISFYGDPTGSLIYQSSERNSRLELRNSAGLFIDEDKDVSAAELGEPIFLPHLAKFQTDTPLNLSVLVANNPLGVVQWRVDGVLQWGFIDDIGEHPADQASYQYSVIMAKGSPVGPNNFPT